MGCSVCVLATCRYDSSLAHSWQEDVVVTWINVTTTSCAKYPEFSTLPLAHCTILMLSLVQQKKNMLQPVWNIPQNTSPIDLENAMWTWFLCHLPTPSRSHKCTWLTFYWRCGNVSVAKCNKHIVIHHLTLNQRRSGVFCIMDVYSMASSFLACIAHETCTSKSKISRKRLNAW